MINSITYFQVNENKPVESEYWRCQKTKKSWQVKIFQWDTMGFSKQMDQWLPLEVRMRIVPLLHLKRSQRILIIQYQGIPGFHGGKIKQFQSEYFNFLINYAKAIENGTNREEEKAQKGETDSDSHKQRLIMEDRNYFLISLEEKYN